MSDHITNFRNFIAKVLFHLFLIFIVLWITGVFVAYITGEEGHIGFDFSPIEMLYTWSLWLKNAWSKLSYSDYSYIKYKLLLSMIAPIIIALTIYVYNFDRIEDIQFIKSKKSVYGDARWAASSDIKRAKLRSKQGMLLGANSGGFFVAGGFEHALLFAPTGSGKGVGFVIPNLLFWEDSIIVHDMKLENYAVTSGWRKKQGQEVFVWAPSSPDGITHCYNPLDWISSKPGQMVDDVQKIANLIIPEKDFWNNEARSLFLGVVLYLLADDTKTKSFGEVVRTMRSDDVVYNLAVALDTFGETMHPVGYMNIAAFLQKADKERSGVISTMNSGLEIWANPLIDIATASSDFSLMEMKKKKTTVYVGMTPDNIQRLQKLMQVFYQQATEFMTRKMPNIKEEPYGVMFLMDEFPTLGKMEQFKSGIAFFRGYRVRLLLIIQDTQQLKGIYEEAGMNSFLSNSFYRITFAANNYETANLISQLCGNQTVEQISGSRPKFFDLNPHTRTENVSHVQRALLLPQEVIQLPRDEQILLIESFPPIKSNKIKYYADSFFTKRLLPETFIPEQQAFMIKKNEQAAPREEGATSAEDTVEDNTDLEEGTEGTVEDNTDLEEGTEDIEDNVETEERASPQKPRKPKKSK